MAAEQFFGQLTYEQQQYYQYYYMQQYYEYYKQMAMYQQDGRGNSGISINFRLILHIYELSNNLSSYCFELNRLRSIGYYFWGTGSTLNCVF